MDEKQLKQTNPETEQQLRDANTTIFAGLAAGGLGLGALVVAGAT